MRYQILGGALVLACAFMTACGVGTPFGNLGGSSGTAVAGNISPGVAMNSDEEGFASNVLDEINAHRGRQNPPLPALLAYDPGVQVAFDHALQMEAHSFFDHVDPNTGHDPATRALNAGITHDSGGYIDPNSGNDFVPENLFHGSDVNPPNGQQIVGLWATSPGHNSQMLAPIQISGQDKMPAWTHCSVAVRWDGRRFWVVAMFFKDPS